MAENRILRNQISGRVQLTDSERKELAEIGIRLGKKVLKEVATIATPETILAWHHKFANDKVDTAERPKAVGRPRIDPEIENLVIRMARENRSWGYDRIQGALLHLGYAISDQTVGNILKRHHMAPAPERKKTVTWREFVRIHLDVLLTTDFFHSKAWNAFGLMFAYLLSWLHFGRHPIYLIRWLLSQQMPTVCSFRLNAFNLSMHVQSWGGWFKTVARSSPTWFRIGIQQPTDAEFNLTYQRDCRPQSPCIVVVLPCFEPISIRDGPIQDDHLRRFMCRDKLPEAA